MSSLPSSSSPQTGSENSNNDESERDRQDEYRSDEGGSDNEHGSAKATDDAGFIQMMMSRAEVLKQEAQARNALPIIPTRLKLPVELEHRIIDHYNTWHDLWLVLRLVSKSWRDYIELIARRRWIPRAFLYYKYKGGPYYTDRGGPIDLDGRFSFTRLEDDGTAIFEDRECDEKKRRAVGIFCGKTCPDLILNKQYIFNIRLRNLVLDKNELRVTVPWRDLIAAIFAEYAAVDAEYARASEERKRTGMQVGLKVMQGELAPEEAMRRLNKINVDSSDSAHIAVRRRRFGEDPREELRIQQARHELPFERMMEQLLEESDGSDDEVEDDSDGEVEDGGDDGETSSGSEEADSEGASEP